MTSWCLTTFQSEAKISIEFPTDAIVLLLTVIRRSFLCLTILVVAHCPDVFRVLSCLMSYFCEWHCDHLRAIVQNVVSLTSSLVVKMLTFLVNKISNSVIFAEKKWVAFANTKATHIISAKIISVYAIFNDQSFSDTLTNDIVCFEQLGPGKERAGPEVINFFHAQLS